MLRLSVQTRQALARLTLPVLIAASFGLMLLGKADAVLAERARMALADALVPIYAALAQPLANVRSAVTEVQDLWSLRAENARLRAENARLRRWQSIALALDAQNRELKANLHWIPQAAPSFVTAPVVADAGGEYAKAVLLALGPHHNVHPGEIALDATGLVGRVVEVGNRTARVLLITDINSRIPVVLEDSHAHAILAGTNGPYPKLIYYPDSSPPREGERVVTSAEANVFPPNLPVGTVRHTAAGVPEVVPDAHLKRLEMVRLFKYRLTGILPPATPAARVAEQQP